MGTALLIWNDLFSITDIDNGQLVPGSILSDEGITDNEGKVLFSFENKAQKLSKHDNSKN